MTTPRLVPRPNSVRFEHHEAGRLGIGESRPRLSWSVDSAAADYHQAAAELEIRVSRSGETLRLSRHVIDGAEQILVPWPAEESLSSRERVSATVRVSDGSQWGEWSAPGEVETGLLEATDWVASFVGPQADGTEGPRRRPSRVRHTFTLPGRPVHARLHLSAHGLAEAEINGTRVGDEELTPGWTSYRHRLRWATFDVTGQLSAGDNAIGIWLADGWWRGRLGYGGGLVDVYGDDIAALAQLEVMTDSGDTVIVASDGEWTVSDGPTLEADLYDGEKVDLRLHDPAWSTPEFDATGWVPVRTQPVEVTLVAPTGPPIRCTEELLPVSVTRKEEGRWLLDFGQNHSGRLRLRVNGPEGTTITLRHAEVLVDGELYTRTLRHAAATDTVTLAGGHTDWEPRATIHGFRYAEINGWPGQLADGDVVSRVLHSDMPRTGWFESSDPSVNRLHENVVWSMRSNFVDLPTDCPQRDERLGWTGDIQVFAPTASFLYGGAGLLTSWLRDVSAEQEEFGGVPFYVPFMRLDGSLDGDPIPPAAVWGDVTVLTPDTIHQRTGDMDVLRQQWHSAAAWVDTAAAAAGPTLICDKTFQFGDWLDPAAPPERPAEATTPTAFVATAYLAHSARRLSDIAGLLGREEEARRYATLSADVAAALHARFFPDGDLAVDTQTAYALTTAFGLWPDNGSRDRGAARLAELVRERRGRIATGFAGTPLVTDALTSSGHIEEAYLLLESREQPSWLSMVDMGATSIWERWDSMLPDGTINPGEMTSFNHYALGSVADWMHRVVAGLAPAAPGYRQIHFAPRPGGSIREASATHLTPYGEASIRWTRTATSFEAHIKVPVGSTATVELPGAPAVDVRHGEHRYIITLEGNEQ